MHFKPSVKKLTIIDIVKFLVILIPPSLIAGPLYAEIVIILCGITYLVTIFKKKGGLFPIRLFNLIFSLFFLSIFISSLFSKSPDISILKAVSYIRFFLFFYFINEFFQKKDFKYFNNLILISVLFVTLDIFFQFIFNFDIFGYEPGMNGLRYQGPFGEEWISGSYLKNFGIIVIINLFLNPNKIYRNYYFLILIIILLLAIFISGEKMALILFSFFIIFFFTINFKNNIRHIIILFGLFLLVVSFINFNNIENFDGKTSKSEKLSYRYSTQFSEILGFSKNSKVILIDTVHGTHFLTAFEIFKKNPIVGSGIKTFRTECANVEPNLLIAYGVGEGRAIHNRCTSHPHNFVLEILSETGIIGFVSYIIFILFILFSFKWRIGINSEKYYPYLYSFLFFIFPIATSGSFFNNYNSIILWIIISFLFFNKNVKM